MSHRAHSAGVRAGGWSVFISSNTASRLYFLFLSVSTNKHPEINMKHAFPLIYHYIMPLFPLLTCWLYISEVRMHLLHRLTAGTL